MNNSLNILNRKIIKCTKCDRLVKFRKKIAKEKRKQYINEKYWGKPITGFGDINGEILLVGLAPAAHGGNRTGRVFTGDRSADFLYKCLYKAKMSNQRTSENKNDGLKLYNTYVTAALKCVPPGDKPTLLELRTCFNYFKQEIDLLKMDIEGAEYEVIEALPKNRVAINQILIEFHHMYKGVPISKTVDAISTLSNLGFELFNISQRTYEFSFRKKGM